MSGFQVYAPTDQRMPMSRIADHARRVESLGYDGLAVPDAVHDGLAVASVALQATTRLKVATGVLVAFPRSPMNVAIAAWDLQELSHGRFELGLGSQVRGNIVGRYSAVWSAPAPRMREYVGALRAIFDCWKNGSELAFEGEHYRFTRMQPFFRPDPMEAPPPPLYIGGVGPKMVALAGEVSNGIMTHPTNTTPRYLREVLRPQLENGAARAGRAATQVGVMVGPLAVTGPDERAVAVEREKTRQLLSFLYSTPSYWPSLALFGWQDRGERLNALTREGRWDEMAGIIDDDMLDILAPQATYAEIGDVLREWYADLTDWITFPLPDDRSHDAAVAKVLANLRVG
jgi:probable F420-dependent oxidoreductase